MNIKVKKKIIYFILISIALSSTIIIFLIFPTIKNIKNLSNDILNQKIDLEKKYEKRYSLRDYLNNLRKIQVSNEELSKNFLKNDEELKLITSIEDIAGKNNLEQKISIGGTINNDNASKELSIELTGDYLNVLKYLYALRRSEYIINLKSITFTSLNKSINGLTSEGNITNNLVAKISALVFYR